MRLPSPTWLAALGALLACGGNPAPDSEPDLRPVGPVRLEVENRSWTDAAIYLLSGGLTRRVGFVTGVSTRTFWVSAAELGVTGEIRLQAHPIGSRSSLTTETLLVHPGQLVRFTLENHLASSAVGVY